LAGASPRQFEAVLRVATRYGIRPDYEELADAVDRFVEDWRNHPEYRWRSAHWPDGAHLEQRLRDRLHRDILDGIRPADEIGDAWAPHLEHRPPPPLTALDEVLLMAKVRSDPDRKQLVESWLRQTLDRELPEAQRVRCLSLPWRRAEPTVDELLLLCRLLPEGATVEPYLFTKLIDAVDARTANQAQRDAYDQLVRRGLLIRDHVPEATPPASGVDRTVHLLLSELSIPESEVAARLADTPAPATDEERTAVIQAMLQAPRVLVVRQVLLAYPMLTPYFADELGYALKARGEPVNAAAAFFLTDKYLPDHLSRAVPKQRHDSIRKQLEQWVERASKRRRDEVAIVVRELGKGWSLRWELLVREKSLHVSWFDRFKRGSAG
jgi:hypothetical protein